MLGTMIAYSVLITKKSIQITIVTLNLKVKVIYTLKLAKIVNWLEMWTPYFELENELKFYNLGAFFLWHLAEWLPVGYRCW